MKNKSWFSWGLTVFLTAAAIMVCYDTIFRRGVLPALLGQLLEVLRPVLFGAAMAYLLAPMVNAADRVIRRLTRARLRQSVVRGCSVLAVWALVFFVLYLLFSILVPQLYQSVVTLAGNAQTYYNTVHNWADKLLDDHPDVAAWVSDAANEYWFELRGWFTDTFLPQARQTLTIVTSGVVSVLAFFRDFFVGMIVSIYLLLKKERSAVNSRKLLYSVTAEPTYRRLLRAAAKADSIFSGFVRGKLLDSFIIGVLCFVGATCLALPYAPLVSVFVGVTNIIPFFGPFLGAIPSAFLILLVSPVKCLYFILFVLVLQQLDGNIIGPKILGDSTELPSFWVIVAILVGGGFFGIPGMFLGVPVFACLYALAGYYRDMLLRRKGVDGDELFRTNDAVRIDKPDNKP